MDGVSLMQMLDGDPWHQDAVFSEYHVEKVHASGYMVRSGTLKYVYVHGAARRSHGIGPSAGRDPRRDGRHAHPVGARRRSVCAVPLRALTSAGPGRRGTSCCHRARLHHLG